MSSSRTPRIRAAALAVAIFACAWGLLHSGFYRAGQIRDTEAYQAYGDRITNALVPYRDFALEYPPGALPVFVLPSLIRPAEGDLAGYQRWFEVEMFFCGAGSLVFMVMALDGLAAGALHQRCALGLAGISPLLLGSVELSRFDLWPVALSTGSVAAFVSGRRKLGSAVLGVAFAAKLYPAVLLPVLMTTDWKLRGRRAALADAAAFLVAAGACFIPFLVLAPQGVLAALGRQTGRPLQIESLGASVLLVLHALTGFAIHEQSAFGSQNLVGGVADVLPLLLTVVQLVAIGAVWAWYARGAADHDRFARACAASVCAFIAFGKVLSPQFLMWLVPLVPLVGGRRGVLAASVLAAALLLTQLWFPSRYWDLALRAAPLESWLVLARNVGLVLLFVVLLAPVRRQAPVPAS